MSTNTANQNQDTQLKISEGTISVTIGCHSISHSIMTTIAWTKLYGRPKLWELSCIFLHDIGHIGKDYLSNKKEKEGHWILGANIAKFLFGKKGYDMIAGHSPKHSKVNKSKLFMADKMAWSISPYPLLYWNALVEPKLKGNRTIIEHITKFKNKTIENVNSKNVKETHDLYLEMYEERKQ